MRKLKQIQNTTIKEYLPPLNDLKPLTLYKVTILNIPNVPELLLLSANLLYTANKILHNEIKENKNKSIEEYQQKALQLMKITEDYQNRYLSNKEANQIKKEFRLKKLYE